MNETLNYIFGTLGVLQKTAKYQCKYNRNIAIFALTTTAYAIFSEASRREQNREIDRLRREVEALKFEKGA